MSAIDSKRFTALGREWEVRFDFNAICEIEERTGEKFMVVAAPFLGLVDMDEVESGSMVAVAAKVDFANLRQLLFWALEGAHEDIELKQAGSIIQAIGLPKTCEIVARAIAKALPTGEAEPEGDENPPKKPARKRPRKAARAG